MIQQQIEAKIRSGLAPQHLEVVNESDGHNVPPRSESHFRVVVVAERFANTLMLERHRTINSILQGELAGMVHALAVNAYTPEEWEARNRSAPESPPCST